MNQTTRCTHTNPLGQTGSLRKKATMPLSTSLNFSIVLFWLHTAAQVGSFSYSLYLRQSAIPTITMKPSPSPISGMTRCASTPSSSASSKLRQSTIDNDGDTSSNDIAIPLYGVSEQVLSTRWVQLVKDGQVCATTVIKEDGEGVDNGISVRYGVKLDENRLLEFVDILGDGEGSNSEVRRRISSINATLAEMQQQRHGDSSNQGMAMECIHDSPFAAQLQLIRTLRPPRNPDMESSRHEQLIQESCTPPQYQSTNSFLVGPLRLFGYGEFHGDGNARHRVASLNALVSSGETSATMHGWDVYHNISPIDPRGHFLLLPTMENSEDNWRDQSLARSDCQCMTYFASTIHPPGSMVLSFNSVGAGASQNHIHCHAWVSPPPPLLDHVDVDNIHGYAATAAKASSEHTPLNLPRGTTILLLEYPCTCVKLSSVSSVEEAGTLPATIEEMGEALSTIVQLAQKMQVPHNVAWTNKPTSVEAYVFFRSRSQSSIGDTPSMLRCGASEMLGIFLTSSREQLDLFAGRKGAMEQILRDVSLEPRELVWKDVCAALSV
eukprot:scaffold1698_cov201-Alexandrium_tamarense.AAC.2